MAIDPDRPCPHNNFESTVCVVRHETEDHEVVGFSTEIRVSCKDCDEQFRWTGVPTGLSSRQPMVSADGYELRAPIRPASSDPDFGMGLPGFTISRTSAPDPPSLP